MKAANEAIFRSFDSFCSERNLALANSGKPRWIVTNPADRKFLKEAKLAGVLSFSASKRIARFDHDGAAYFCAIGFDNADDLSGLIEVDLNGSFLTLILSELKPRPTVAAIKIKDVVEAEDKGSDPNYSGHDFSLIADFFPKIRIRRAEGVDESETWKIFFQLCLLESRGYHSWIEEPLIITLESICDLGLINIPYATLCRSIFDTDPAAMFLALYRCIEAIYAYSSARKVIRGLGLDRSWTEVAIVLEDQLGWHPREENSLSDLMAHALKDDLNSLISSMRQRLGRGENLRVGAAKRIYQLRNSLVHYRPSQQREDLSGINWNGLCIAMAGIVNDMYSGVFP